MKNNKNLYSLALASAALILFLILISSTASAAPYGYIINRDSNTVSVIDISKYSVAATVPVGKGPTGIAVNPNGTKVYVTNWVDNNVSVIDTATKTVTATVNVGDNPGAVAVTLDGKKVYFVNVGDGTVSVIDTVTNNVIATVPVGGTDRRGIAVTPDGKKVYVTNWVDNTVSVIDTATNNVATVKAGVNPGGVAVTPDGTKVYVANYGSNDVTVIDTATNNVITTVPAVGWGPGSVAITPDGTKVYVTTYHNPYYVYVIDTTRDEVIGEVKNIGKFPIVVAITTDGTQAYVVSEGTGTVSVIDTCTNEVKYLWNNIGPGAIAFQPANYSTHQRSTTTALTSSPNPSKFRQSVTLTAEVSTTCPGAVAPSGTVTFFDGTIPIGNGTVGTIIPGQATLTNSSLSVDPHSITAEYNGDNNFKSSKSPVLTQTVVPEPQEGGNNNVLLQVIGVILVLAGIVLTAFTTIKKDVSLEIGISEESLKYVGGAGVVFVVVGVLVLLKCSNLI